MRKLAMLCLFLLTLSAVAQTTGAPDAALMQKIWDAWSTLDPANAAQFYDKSPNNVYFDITPMEYHGWAQYEAGAKKVLADYTSGDCKVAQPSIHPAGSLAWGTSLVHCDMTKKDGEKEAMGFRWTVIWKKNKAANEWLIVHEQISVPLPQEVGGGARPPRKPKKS